MTMSQNPFEAISMIAMCQVVAPITFLRLPEFGKLTVTKVSVYEADKGGRRNVSRLSPLYLDVQPLPKRTVIQFKDSRGSGYNISISHEDLSVHSNDGGLFSEPYGGSGEIGLALIGLPSLLVTSPILIANGLGWAALEKVVGMNRYAWTVWLRLKDQLDVPTRDLLQEALKRLG
jgi:hypothetical protein